MPIHIGIQTEGADMHNRKPGNFAKCGTKYRATGVPSFPRPLYKVAFPKNGEKEEAIRGMNPWKKEDKGTVFFSPGIVCFLGLLGKIRVSV